MIKVENFSYKKGNKIIFDNLNFELSSGKIIALLGENGSGKTTILRLLSGLALNWQGKIEVAGKKINEQTKKDVAVLPSLNDFPRDTTIKQVLAFYQRFYPDFDKEKSQKLLHFMELEEKEKIKTLSRGQKEKVALVATLSRNAKIYLLDEPLSGIDLLSREKIIHSLLRWFDDESLLIITTHQMAEIENIVDEVLILKNRQIVLHEELETLREEQHIGLEGIYREVLKNKR